MPTAQARAKTAAKSEVEAAKAAGGVQKAEAKPHGEVVQRDQRKGAEAPEDEGVGQAGQRALADDFGLAEHLPDKVPDAAADGKEAGSRRLFWI